MYFTGTGWTFPTLYLKCYWNLFRERDASPNLHAKKQAVETEVTCPAPPDNL